MNRLAVLSCVLILCAACHKAPRPSPIPEDQLAIINDGREALAGLAKRSKTAADLLTFYDANAVLAKNDGPGKVKVVKKPKTDAWFLVSADPRPVTAAEHTIFARFECTKGRTMGLRDMKMSPFPRGLMFAHELSHAKDCTLFDEPPSDLLDDNWVLGELHAHTTVAHILAELDPAWDVIVQASRERREAITASMGKRPESAIFGALPEDVRDLQEHYGPDEMTINVLHTQLDVDANILNVAVMAERYGLPEAEAQEHEIEMVRNFYARFVDTIVAPD